MSDGGPAVELIEAISSDARGTAADFEQDTDHERTIRRDLDDCRALIFMRDVLDRLVDDKQVIG